MNILLTNDDGIYTPGLRALRLELLKLGNVTVVAPATVVNVATANAAATTLLRIPIRSSSSCGAGRSGAAASRSSGTQDGFQRTLESPYSS